MTEKIFEYKDDKDWYVGKLEGDGFRFSFSSAELDLIVTSLNNLLLNEDNHFKIALGVIKYSSPYRLIHFYLELINALENRSLKAVAHKGAVLVVEKEKVLFVHVPKGGIEVSAFLDGA